MGVRDKVSDEVKESKASSLKAALPTAVATYAKMLLKCRPVCEWGFWATSSGEPWATT